MTDDAPLILTTKDHRICHERWLRWKLDFSDRVGLARRLFELAECSVRAFGPHLQDVWWLDRSRLYEDVYGHADPIDTLLDVMHFPSHSDMVDRTRYVADVRKLILEHEDYGSDGNYMPRSVVLGWIARQHDLILGDLKEVA